MSSIYHCRHHGRAERTYGELSWRMCGCDGAVHYACDPRPAPAGTPRPANWPIFLTFRTEDHEPTRTGGEQ